MARLIYSLLVVLLLPWAVLHLLWRSRRQPAYRQHWAERFGLFGKRLDQPVIWIHAVSVGETRAAQPLVTALQAHYPSHRILLTHMTPTGRETSLQLFGSKVERVYLPYDTPWAMQRFLRHFRPACGIVMETELWPNLVHACDSAHIPLLLVNARLSERSANRYRKWLGLSRQTLGKLAAIGAQNDDDAARLSALGAREVRILGNMKFDIEPPAAQVALGKTLRSTIGERTVFLCASTREGEEALILDSWPRNQHALLIIVPRHPQRFNDVAALVAARGFRFCRRSAHETPQAETEVWLGDSMGEMFAWYAAADVAFIGGSLLDYGSQNLIEPCSVGTPVLIGPSTFNFAAAAREAIAMGAAISVPNVKALVQEAMTLLGDAQRRTATADLCLAFASHHRGATGRTLALIERFIPAAR